MMRSSSSRTVVLALAVAAACGPGQVAMTDGSPTTTTAGSAEGTDSLTGAMPTPTSTMSVEMSSGTTMPALPDTTTGSSGGPDPETTTTTTTTTTATTASTTSTASTDATTSTSAASSSTADTGDICPADTVVCIDDTLEVCDGLGGFEGDGRGEGGPATCEYGCLDASGCRSCAQALADKACPAGLPRVMVLLDASSSMLNFNGNTQHAPPGFGAWDQVRDALAGVDSIFALEQDGEPLRDRALVGLAVFGHDDPNEARLLVPYGPCHADNFAWALDPHTACEPPGCTDPYHLPPISWTFKDGSLEDPPGFATKTLNHMPRCDPAGQMLAACGGSATFLHRGLDLVLANLVEHQATCPGAELECTDATQFINILIVDGKYNSSDAQVQAPLTAMFAAGVTTHVIGHGDAIDAAQLAKLADWGSGGQLGPHISVNQSKLETALALILATLGDC